MDESVAIGVARLENAVGKTRLIRRVREALGLKTECASVRIHDAIFPFGFSIEKVTAVELDARLIGDEFHAAPTFWVGDFDH